MTPVSIGYFGKIPGRGDFVKASDNPALLVQLDDWLTGTLELMSADPNWKTSYDAAAPLHFAILGPRRRHAIAGHVVASADQSGRRFPLLMMAPFAVTEPATFVPAAPLVLNRLWNRIETLVKNMVAATDADAPLQAAAGQTIDVDLRAAAYDAAFADFIDLQTVGTLQALLAQAGHAVTLRRILLALGMLLQPVLASSASRLDKSLVLPLPADPLYRSLAAVYWMRAITPFLARADFELALFVTRLDGRPCLVLGFTGASPRTLHAILHPRTGKEHHIAFDDLDWVEDEVDADYAVQKMAGRLQQPDLPLGAALELLKATFLGS